MKRKWIFFVAPPAAVLLIFACGQIILHLWNWLIPPLTGWHTIGFWQALGLWLLSRFFFGGFGGGHHGRGGTCRRRDGKSSCLTPEEQEKLRQNFGSGAAPQS